MKFSIKKGKKMAKKSGKKKLEPTAKEPTKEEEVEEEDENSDDNEADLEFNPDFKFDFSSAASSVATQRDQMQRNPTKSIGRQSIKTSVDELIEFVKMRRQTVDEKMEIDSFNGEKNEQPEDGDGKEKEEDKDRIREKGGKAGARLKRKRRRQREAAQERFADKIEESNAGCDTKSSTGAGFLGLNLSRPLLRSVSELGWQLPTPVQAACVPLALVGRDICACARTGSGKTAAFFLPIIERLLHKPAQHCQHQRTRVLILCPTRELAVQTEQVGVQLIKYCKNRVQIGLTAGGLDLKRQEAMLRNGPDIVVATPGRLIDHAHNAPSFNLTHVEILVLDEADRLIDEFFLEQIKEIVRLCSPTRQVLLFSATMTDDVKELSAVALKDPAKVFVNAKEDVEFRLQQQIVRIRKYREADRDAIVAALVQRSFHTRTIVFCPTKRQCHRMHVLLGLLGIKCAELHSNLSQTQRLESMERFHANDVGVLLATDLASRGLDIEGVQTVINYRLPSTVKVYTHRVGRTARAGRLGLAVSLVGEDERQLLKQIVKQAPMPMQQRTLAKETIANYRERIQSVEQELQEVLKVEKVESAQRAAEQALNKAERRLRGERVEQRNWFELRSRKRIGGKK